MSTEQKINQETWLAFIHGLCKQCGKQWHLVESDRDGFSKLECPHCGCYRYENNELGG